jgi:hypothetical protein
MIVTDAKEKTKERGQTDLGTPGAVRPITAITIHDHPILALTRRRDAADLDQDMVVAAVTSEVEGELDPTTSAIFVATRPFFQAMPNKK